MRFSKEVFEPLDLQKLYVGVGWKNTGNGAKGWRAAINRQKGTDLDVWAIGLDEDGTAVAMAWFDDRDPFEDGTLAVSEDNTTGKGPGDDEFITADLSRLTDQITDVVYGVSAFKEGVTFASISSVTARIVDQGNGNKELGKFMLDIDSNYSAAILCKTHRTDAGWDFASVREMGHGRSKRQLIQLAQSAVRKAAVR